MLWRHLYQIVEVFVTFELEYGYAFMTTISMYYGVFSHVFNNY
jgi:hypothetical protein